MTLGIGQGFRLLNGSRDLGDLIVTGIDPTNQVAQFRIQNGDSSHTFELTKRGVRFTLPHCPMNVGVGYMGNLSDKVGVQVDVFLHGEPGYIGRKHTYTLIPETSSYRR